VAIEYTLTPINITLWLIENGHKIPADAVEGGFVALPFFPA
jgi:hypothetical protein